MNEKDILLEKQQTHKIYGHEMPKLYQYLIDDGSAWDWLDKGWAPHCKHMAAGMIIAGKCKGDIPGVPTWLKWLKQIKYKIGTFNQWKFKIIDKLSEGKVGCFHCKHLSKGATRYYCHHCKMEWVRHGGIAALEKRWYGVEIFHGYGMQITYAKIRGHMGITVPKKWKALVISLCDGGFIPRNTKPLKHFVISIGYWTFVYTVVIKGS